MFSICGQLMSRLPVWGWLRVALSYIKRRANAAATSWDDNITDSSLYSMLPETLQRMNKLDLTRGRWNVAGDEATL